MSRIPRELIDIFPDAAEIIHRLNHEHAQFARLSEAYSAVNREIHRAESGIEPMDDLALEGLKKKRLYLQDQIAAMLRAEKAHAMKYRA